jgi:3-methyladenine DNA glycosylase AlkD
MLTRKSAEQSLEAQVDSVIVSLKRLSSKRTRDGMARYGLPSDKAFGVGVGQMQKLAKRLGRNHELAEALWQTGWYEARMMSAFLDVPERVTPSQMDRWCRDFDNWGIVDTVCFKLFDQTPFAFRKAVQWSTRKDEFQKRAGFVLVACLGVHDKQAADEQFRRFLPFIEKAADDDRNFVKKGVNWALRVIGRRSLELNIDAVQLAQRL